MASRYLQGVWRRDLRRLRLTDGQLAQAERVGNEWAVERLRNPRPEDRQAFMFDDAERLLRAGDPDIADQDLKVMAEAVATYAAMEYDLRAPEPGPYDDEE